MRRVPLVGAGAAALPQLQVPVGVSQELLAEPQHPPDLNQPRDFIPRHYHVMQQLRRQADGRPCVLFGPPTAHAEEPFATVSNSGLPDVGVSRRMAAFVSKAARRTR